MKQTLILIYLLISYTSQGQVLAPATWQYRPSTEEVHVGDTLDLIFTVSLDDTWYLYSNDFDPGLGPMLTEFEFVPHKSYQLIAKTKAINPKRKYDRLWQGEISYFEGKAQFRQRIKVLEPGLEIKGKYAYQVCSIIDGKCIPGSGAFSFTGIRVLAGKQWEERTGAGRDSPPAIGGENSRKEENRILPGKEKGKGLIEVRKPEVKQTKAAAISSPGVWEFTALAFLAGLAALLTPCVFPMVPMTVTFFSYSSRGKGTALHKALTYGFSIIMIYTVAGTLVAWANGPAFANWLSTHWLPNLFFFAVFMFFALSFLGLFDISLPAGLVNAADRKADKGGLTGIFFMAFTLVLVSFSCTGPIVGALLVASAGGEVLLPILGMASFALAIALPFTLFAAFPQWLDRLPRSGSWLNKVKVVLGFLELALGLKFLSIADQVYHWGILDREVYLALWIVIFTMIGLYLLGKVKLPNDDWFPQERVGVPGMLLAIAAFAFVVYLVPGMFGAPLKALAGYLPPMSTHDYNLTAVINNARGTQAELYGPCDDPLYADKLHFPHGIRGYFDLEQALACARQQGKPLFIDFTGHGCVNCREMEARVWSEPEVLRRLKQDFVMVALYIDEKTELPSREWYVSTFDDKIKRTIGAQNADYQITRFNNNAQPYYAIIDPYTEELLVEPMAYDLEVNNFVKFLEEGKETFEKKQSLAMDIN